MDVSVQIIPKLFAAVVADSRSVKSGIVQGYGNGLGSVRENIGLAAYVYPSTAVPIFNLDVKVSCLDDVVRARYTVGKLRIRRSDEH